MVPCAAATGSLVANIFGFQSNVLCQVSELPDAGSSNRWRKPCSSQEATVPASTCCTVLCMNLLPPPLGRQRDLRQGLPVSALYTHARRCKWEWKRPFQKASLTFPSVVLKWCHFSKRRTWKQQPISCPLITWWSETQWACLPSRLFQQLRPHPLPLASFAGGSHCCLPDWCWRRWSWSSAPSLALVMTGPLSGSQSHLVGDKVEVEGAAWALNEVRRCASRSLELFTFLGKKSHLILVTAMIKWDWYSFPAYGTLALLCKLEWIW